MVRRHERIPDDAQKQESVTDRHPPVMHSSEYGPPAPIPGPINTAGAEDSPFILPDGRTLYLFFTPDVSVPPEKQLLDGVSGIWVSNRVEDQWTDPTRVWLQEPEKLALDGAVSIQGGEMWFASVREGYVGVNMFTADLVDGQWVNSRYAGDRLMFKIQIGEVHLHGDHLYFHSDRPGGKGGYDIWVTARENGTWSDPVNIEPVNTESMDGFPFISADGREMWFTRTYLGTPAVYRSMKEDGEWTEPELIVSQYAGEPTLDAEGNLYFVHHYYEDSVMLESDIYVAYRKR
ncbi:MAG: hypothetical protein R6U70_05885 [Bacillota bacterium]